MLTQNTAGQDLGIHQWKQRIVIVKSSEANNPLFQKQLEQFKEAEDGLKERKLVLYAVQGSTSDFVDYSADSNNNAGQLKQESIQRLLKTSEDFEVLLIGLDGGVKLRQTEILKLEELFRTIDAMPMRRSERKNK
ncbi:DUF4174 domain-containing protein [Gilvibacter sediminis]|uniref:DUF4174 domain-containing protein n=1 Tax=Gilvibacter sediminis TaxID=379071 RepID=UPI002350E414|nr:DUF4174 domain-containing protein [Gilvibacter sediminis]MDC7998042.1 DUF4174 domain-containing protein [Gilvibacter sediminis]